MNKYDGMYWRYKKKAPPTDDNASLNGEVKTIRPKVNPFKCSKCDFIGTKPGDIKQHWFGEH